MKIRVLGAHNMETAQTRHTCFLVDDSLAIDAGSLMTALTSHEKNRLRAILLTHRHFDHVRDLPSLGLQTMDNGVTVDLYGLPDTLDAISTRLMDGLLYPNFTVRPTPECPKYRMRPIAPGRAFNVCGLGVLPLSVPHGAPAVGFVVRKGIVYCGLYRRHGRRTAALPCTFAAAPSPLRGGHICQQRRRPRPGQPPPHPVPSERGVRRGPKAGTALAASRRSAPGPAPRASHPPRTRPSLPKPRTSPSPPPTPNQEFRL